jgi:hypothetical protein
MIKIIKLLANFIGYKIALIKAENGSIDIQGDKELLKYIDITGYTFKKEPLKRTFPKPTKPEYIVPLTPEQLKEVGL